MSEESWAKDVTPTQQQLRGFKRLLAWAEALTPEQLAAQLERRRRVNKYMSWMFVLLSLFLTGLFAGVLFSTSAHDPKAWEVVFLFVCCATLGTVLASWVTAALFWALPVGRNLLRGDDLQEIDDLRRHSRAYAERLIRLGGKR